MMRRAYAALGLLVAGGLTAYAAGASAQDVSRTVRVHTGPERSSIHTLFGPRLSAALTPGLTTELVQSTGTMANLEAVLRNPDDVAFAQLDLFRQFVAKNPEAESKLEFYGDVPVCVLLVSRSGSPWMLPSSEIPDEVALKSLDIGPIGGDAAVSLEALVESAPRLTTTKLENRGGSRALARVRRRDTELAAFVEFPSAQTPIIEDVLTNESIDFIGSIASVFKGAKVENSMTFVPTELEMSQPSFFKSDRPIRTVCTSVGVAINADGNADVIEAVVHSVTEGELINSDTWSLGFVFRVWNRLWDSAMDWYEKIWVGVDAHRRHDIRMTPA